MQNLARSYHEGDRAQSSELLAIDYLGHFAVDLVAFEGDDLLISCTSFDLLVLTVDPGYP